LHYHATKEVDPIVSPVKARAEILSSSVSTGQDWDEVPDCRSWFSA